MHSCRTSPADSRWIPMKSGLLISVLVVALQGTDANSVMHGYIRNPDGSFVTIDDPNAPKPRIRWEPMLTTSMQGEPWSVCTSI